MNIYVIYVIYGATGEYSDHCEWPVCAFLEEEKAKDYVIKVTARANELLQQYEIGWRIPSGANELDSGMSIDYTGINYSYWTVEVK